MDGEAPLKDLLDASLLAEVKRIELRTSRSVNAELLGKYRSAFRGSGLIYSDLREYLPGDDVKNIHWKVTARTNRVFVKSYEEDRELRIIVAVDVSNSTNFGSPKTKHRKALEFAALISILARKSQDSVGLCLFSDDVEEFYPPKKSRSQHQRILLSLLQERTLRRGTNIAKALSHLRDFAKRSSVIFLVSDFYSTPFDRELRALAFRNDVICVLLGSSEDADLPQLGIVEYEDAEGDQRYILDTSSRRGREQLINLMQRRVQALKELCVALGVDFIEIGEHPLKPLAALMHRRTARIR